MRLIIGIVIGVLIVFNWSTVRELFDASLVVQSSGKVEATEGPAAISPSPQLFATPVQPAQPASLSSMVDKQLKDAADRK